MHSVMNTHHCYLLYQFFREKSSFHIYTFNVCLSLTQHTHTHTVFFFPSWYVTLVNPRQIFLDSVFFCCFKQRISTFSQANKNINWILLEIKNIVLHHNLLWDGKRKKIHIHEFTRKKYTRLGWYSYYFSEA